MRGGNWENRPQQRRAWGPGEITCARAFATLRPGCTQEWRVTRNLRFPRDGVTKDGLGSNVLLSAPEAVRAPVGR